jgi:hypothetical protein
MFISNGNLVPPSRSNNVINSASLSSAPSTVGVAKPGVMALRGPMVGRITGVRSGCGGCGRG